VFRPGSLSFTRDDAEAGWARMVQANRVQVERLREDQSGDDFYAPVSEFFRADPGRSDDPSLNALLDLTHPDDVWLDVGAGGGRYSLRIARSVRRLIAVEPSESMRRVFSETAAEYKIANVEVRDERWPPLGAPPSVDVAFISHIGYDIERIGPFLDALEAAADRTCVALLMEPSPLSALASIWPAVHGEEQDGLPGLADFLALLLARGSLPEMQIVDCYHWRFESVEEAIQGALRRLWLAPDGAKASRLRDLLDAELEADSAGGFRFRWRSRVGLVQWDARFSP
jgi:SAM-dependent methyltransferase